ncbi:hypothetical protein [Robbsia sp. KACC 23696]|uniref:hypothetical protein n=1 Tax=Robbsia sp. KACC 23696 TaxID=3149231 RepID=UPI00325C1689
MHGMLKDTRELSYSVRRLAVTVLSLAALGGAIVKPAQADDSGTLQSGVYTLRTDPNSQLDSRKVYLAVDQGEVSGYFDNPYTQPARNVPDLDPTCRFLLHGSVSDGTHIVLQSSYPEKESGKSESGGTLTLTKNDRGWEVTVNGDLPNCEVATVSDGETLTLSKVQPDWRGFGYVAVAKAPLYTSASERAKSAAYLVRYDPVAVLRQSGQPGWLYAEYLNARKGVLKRWMKSSDVQEK